MGGAGQRVKRIRPQGGNQCGRMSERELDLLLLGSGGGGDSSLSGLRLGHALLEFINASGGIDELLLAGVKRVAGVANTKDGRRFGRAGLDYIAAGATDFRFVILRVQVSFHIKRVEKVSAEFALTSAMFEMRESNGQGFKWTASQPFSRSGWEHWEIALNPLATLTFAAGCN